MSTQLWVLLLFAAWTVLVLLSSIGVHRWSQILMGRAQLRDWVADVPQGPEWYRRAMRAHANCVENLPLYTAVVVVLEARNLQGPALDMLCLILIGARVVQSMIHIIPEQTNLVVGIRFSFFFVQLVSMVAMGVIAAAA